MTISEMGLASPSSAGRMVPRDLEPGRDITDRIFHSSARSVGLFVLVVTGSIGVFLGYQAIPTLRHYGLSFFTQSNWEPQLGKIGIAAVLVGTVEVALVAMAVGFPLALGLALFITEYAPARIKSWLVSTVDLMAAVPSIIYGLWGFFLLQPRAIEISRWLSQYLGWIPIFHVDTNPNAPVWQQSAYTSSVFIAGLAVSMMTIPLACAVMRAVFDHAPIGEREAAMALGGTRFSVIKAVVLPFSRGGIIGGTMLALGRALGETACVLVIISPEYIIKPRILEAGTQTTSALIAGNFGDASKAQLSALLAAGFVLFLITLVVNSAAAVVIRRSRSGTSTEI
ncbi:MAG: phosphate ABC transporter permease subunit PstC [Acidimicrobiales bacterium]